MACLNGGIADLNGTRPVPATVWAAVATLAAVAACYSILIPAWRAPDEASHVDLVYQVSERWTWPAWDDAYFTEGVAGHTVPPSPRAEADAPDDRPSLGELGGADLTDRPNHIAQHPPPYYVLGAATLAAADPVLPGDPTSSAESTVGLLRLGNAALIAATPLLAWILARRSGAGRPLALTAAVTPLLVPGFAQIGGTVNNDNLLPVPIGLAMIGLVAVLGGDRRPGVCIGTGLAMGVAAVTKATALFVLVPAVLVVIATIRASGVRPAIRTALSFGLPVLVLSGWWYLPKLVREGRLVPSVQPDLRSDLPPGPTDFGDDFGDWFRTFLEWTSDTFVSRAGVVEVELADWVTVVTAGAIVLCLVIGTAWPTGRRVLGPERRAAVVLVSPAVVLFAAQAVRSWDSYSPTTGLAPLLHGRYLYAYMVPLVVVVARGLHALAGPRLARWLPATVIVAGGALHATASVEALDRFWGVGAGVGRADVLALVAWSPWPVPVTVGLFAAAATAALLLVVSTGRELVTGRAR